MPGEVFVVEGVWDLRSSIASLADENWWCRPVTSTHTGAGEPVEVYGAGVSGVTGLLLRARGSVSWQRSLRTGAVRRWSPHGERRDAMAVMFDRVAGLDVGKETVTVCLRTPGPRGGHRAETRTFKTMTGPLGE